MWTFGLCVVALLVIYCSHWINKWRNPKCNGVLPPGSMGLPLIGETLQLLIPDYSIDVHPFIKKRLQRYGSIFRTSVAGRPLVISADPEINHYILQQEGKSVEIWYLDAFSKIFVLDGESRTNAAGLVHKYIRSLFLNHFGAESLKQKLLFHIEDTVNKNLCNWSSQGSSIEAKHAASVMIFDFTAKQLLGYDAEKSPEKLSDMFTNIIKGFMCFPLNIPGTTYHKCMKAQKKIFSMLRDMIKERRGSSDTHGRDLLDQLINDMDTETYLTEDFIVYLMFGGLFANFESISSALALALNFLADHPSALQELTAEHEAILRNRENPDSSLTWDEYRSMTFTLWVINETLRLGTVSPGLFRRALKDLHVKDYTIPAGWTIVAVTFVHQLNPDTYNDPLAFNPWRWKDLDSYTVCKSFMPFGGGQRQCAGAEYSRVFIATFLHVLVTKYKWTKIKGGDLVRSPMLRFRDGLHIKFSEKHN